MKKRQSQKQLTGSTAMKLQMNRISQGEDEVIIRYQEMTEQIEAIAAMVDGGQRRILAQWEDRQVVLRPEEILYFESVDNVTFAYLTDKVVRVDSSLTKLGVQYSDRGFFRCSKSMVLNIYKITYLKSEPNHRIRATMENGEEIMISRKYAKELRHILKRGRDDEDE